MLPERVRQLLTGYVDGELNSGEMSAVQRLLRQSAEARAFLNKLEQDAHALKTLPRFCLGADFTERVLKSSTQRSIAPKKRPTLFLSRGIPAWATVTTAASVLLVLGTGWYLYFSALVPQKPSSASLAERKIELPRIAKKAEVPTRAPIAEDIADPVLPPVSKENETPALVEDPPAPAPVTPLPVIEPPVRETSIVANPARPNPMIVEVHPRIPLSLALRELEKESARDSLRLELGKDAGYRLELFCLDQAKSLERLQSLCDRQGIRLLVEAEITSRQIPRSDLVFYSDNLAPGELALLLEQLGSEDKKAELKRRGEGQFGKVIVRPMNGEDHQEVSKLLGFNPQANFTRPKAPLGVDIRKPLSDSTTDEVVRLLAKKGMQQPEGSKPAVAASKGRSVLVTVSYPRRRVGPSREGLQFLESRKEKRSGSIQMFLVLHAIRG